MTAKKVIRNIMNTGRDYALFEGGDIWSVNAIGLEIIDVRWYVVRDGRFVGDQKDRACLESIGHSPESLTNA